MDEQLFLKQLSLQLKGLQEEEIQNIVSDYASYFSTARNKGLTDAEIIQQLGHPREIVKDILKNQQQPQSRGTAESRIQSVIVGIGLILFNLIFVLGIALGLVGAFIGLFIACLTFIISPLLAGFSLMFYNGTLFEMFLSLTLCGIGLIIFPYFKKGAEKGLHLAKRYIQWNLQVIRGEN